MEIVDMKQKLPDIFIKLCHEVQVNDAIVDWVDITFEQIGNASKCPPHSHTWFEFNYVLSGQVQTCVNDVSVTIRKDEFFLIPPTQVHSHIYTQNKPHEGICLRWRIREQPEGLKEGSLFTRLDQLKNWTPGSYRDTYGIKEIMLFFFQGASSGQSVLTLQLLLIQVLEKLTGAQMPEEAIGDARSSPLDSLVKKVDVYLEDFAGERLNVTELAASLHMSYGHLSRLYKSRAGITLIERMNQLRLYKACELLQTTTIRINEVSEMSGFPDVYYFSKAFKRQFGTSPLGYRQKFTSKKLE